MTAELRPPHEDLTFMTPLSEARADRLVRFLADGLDGADLDGTVLDLGCGWAELLLRVLAVAPAARGVGVDLDETSIAHGRGLAVARGLDSRLELLAVDARAQTEHHPQAVICIGASQIWGPPVEAAQPLDYTAALVAVRGLVEPGARVVFGEGIWSRPPTAAAVAPLGGRLDELITLPELVELAVSHGFMPAAIHEADLDEWDEFESGYSACYAAWLAENGPDHPDAPAVRERAARQRTGYLAGYRGILGLAYLCLVAV